MGVCLSRCGDAQQKAGIVAATISHQNSLGNATELHDPNHSLKKFLHLYEIADSRRSLSSPRGSLGESLQIPHSSELFSLPDSDAERPSCCISPSPARTSRASVSSRNTSSPKSTRNSFSTWGGRFSMDKTVSVGCRKKIRPARSSKSSLAGDQDLVAHQRLVEAIARLERLNNGKNLELRGSSFCSSDLKPKTQVLPKSRSGRELKRPGQWTSRSRYVRQQELPAHLLKSTMSPRDHESQAHVCDRNDSHCCSSTHDPDLARKSNYVEDPALMMRPEGFSQPKTMGNLISLAGPIIKQMPLEKSVTDFLKEVENFVSLIEAPRLSLSSEAAMAQERKDSQHEPLIITTHSRSVEESECETRLPSYRFEDTDSDEQFTFFEASFEDSEMRKKEWSPLAKSLQRLVQSSTQGSHSSKKSFTAENNIALPVAESSKNSTVIKISSSCPQQILPVVNQFGCKSEKATPMELIISEDPGIKFKRNDKIDALERPALKDVDTNVVPMTKKSPNANKSPLKMKPVKGIRRGFSRSLDSREGSVTKVDFDLIRNGPIHVATSRLSNSLESSHSIEAASSTEAKGTELGLLQVSNTSSPNEKRERAGCELNELH